jgi:hypothetical protein
VEQSDFKREYYSSLIPLVDPQNKNRETLIRLEEKIRTLELLYSRLQHENYLLKLNIHSLVADQVSLQMAYEISKTVVKGIENQIKPDDILDEIKLVLDKESQKSITDARLEYEKGKIRTLDSVDELIRSLKS